MTREPWGSVATLGWGFLALLLAQLVVAGVLWELGGEPAVGSRYDGAAIALGELVATPIQVLVLVIAARRAGWNVLDYLGLTRFGIRDLLIGVLATFVLTVAIDLFGLLIGHALVSPFQVETFVSVPNRYWLAALIFAVIVVAPLGEEVLFRGFLFRGWVRADRSPVVGIVIIAALWTALHLQYDWFGMAQVFLIGLLLGWMRRRSGSTALAVVMHGVMNLQSTVETMTHVGLLS